MVPDSQELLDRFRAGDEAAAKSLLDRYAQRLLALARGRLSQRLARRIDPEDVVQSAYRSFFLRARAGEFHVEREGDLWRLLAAITLHKLWRQAKHHRAGKRAIGREEQPTGDDSPPLEQLASREPSVADVVVAADELRWLLTQLAPHERQAVELRLQDIPLDQIAAQMARSERTVRRSLAKARDLLRQRWAEADRHSAAGELPDARWPAAASIDAPLRHADYHLEALIGSGGMSKVYAASHRASGARVAVKVLRKRFRDRRHLVEHFVQEAAIVARLGHPGIVPVHGLGRMPDGNFFLVFDHVDGVDLEQLRRHEPLLAKRRPKSWRRWPTRSATPTSTG